MLTFDVDVPPPLSKCFTNVPRKGRVKTTAYRKYAKRTGDDIELQLMAQKNRLPEAPYALDVWVYLKNDRRTDGDNRMKAAQDVLSKTLGFDDSVIVDTCVHTRVIKSLKCERCVMRLARSKLTEGPSGAGRTKHELDVC